MNLTNYELITNEGFSVTIHDGPTLADLSVKLNDRRLVTLPLGDVIISKNIIKAVIPIGTLSGAHEIHTNDGVVYRTDIPDYDGQALSDNINSGIDFVLIGDTIIHKHNIKIIMSAPVKPAQ